MIDKISDVIIVGAGPAGIACAIQLNRYKIDSIIFEMDVIGGLIKNANFIENFIGFPNGISGKKFIQLLNKQSKNNTLNIIYETVEDVKYIENSFIVYTNKGKYHSKILVIASGTKPIIPKSPIISDNVKDKVFFDVFKLGQVKNDNITIIGAGDCAFDYALNLSHNNKVSILNRGNKVKALPILYERILKHKNIKYFKNTSINKINLKNEKLQLVCNPINDSLLTDYLLIAIGREPNLDFINIDILNNPNLFLVGDVNNGQFRQASIAIGDGTFTAMKINNTLNK